LYLLGDILKIATLRSSARKDGRVQYEATFSRTVFARHEAIFFSNGIQQNHINLYCRIFAILRTTYSNTQMKTFKSYLNASLAEDRNQFHIIVIGDAAEIENTEESKWLESGIKDYWKRVEKPNEDSTELHVHMARKKHVHTVLRKISWHVNGFKHDKLAFNDNLNGVKTANTLATAVLKLPAGKTLEMVPNENARTILAGIDYLPNKCKIFVFKIANGSL